MKQAIAFLLMLLAPFVAVAAELKPFTTDGCSVFPDGTPEQQSLWVNCCIRHDLAYWKGGTYKERETADLALQQCVEKMGQPEIAQIMLTGVRMGGSPFFPTWYRWGYGWPFLRGYKALSAEEKGQVKARLKVFEVMLKGITEELEARGP
jgi:hypothetical protein